MRAPARSSINLLLFLYSGLLVGTSTLAWTFYWKNGKSPMLRPLFDRLDRGHDLTNYAGKMAHLNASTLGSGLPVFNYPAPAAYIYKLFLGGFPHHPVAACFFFLIACAIAFAVVAWVAAGPSGRRIPGFTVAVLCTTLLNFPLWYAADRGNIEGVVWAISGAGLCFLLAQRYRWAAVLIGIAGAIKPFPILFLALLLARKRLREALLGVCVAAALFLAALTALGPNPFRAYNTLKPGMNIYLATYAEAIRSPDEQRVYHSLEDDMKIAILIAHTHSLEPTKLERTAVLLSDPPHPLHSIHRAQSFYIPFAALAALVAVLVFYRLPLLNQLTAVSIGVTLLPLGAAEYTLLHIYVAAGAFLIFLIKDVATGEVAFPNSASAAILACYGLLLAPLSFLRIYEGFAQSILLVVLLVLAAAFPMPLRPPQSTLQPTLAW